jgi:hypothetical protein
MLSNFRSIPALAIVLAGVTAGGLAAHAATDCKTNTTETACKAAADCSWVKGYTISKGKQAGKKVEAFCRKKPVRHTSAKPTKAAKAPKEGMSGMSGMSGSATGMSGDKK